MKLITSADQTTASTIHQQRLGHGYFKSFLIRLPPYESTQCQYSERVQSVRHLLLECRLHQDERQQARITRVVLTTVQTANRMVWFAHKPNRAQLPRFSSPHEPHYDTTVRFVGRPNHHGLPWFATVSETSAVHGFSWFVIFFHAVFIHTQI